MSVPVVQLDGSVGLDVKVLMSPPIVNRVIFLCRCHGIDVEMLMSVPVAQLAGSVGLDIEVLVRLPVVDCRADWQWVCNDQVVRTVLFIQGAYFANRT